MTPAGTVLTGARVAHPDGAEPRDLAFAGGHVVHEPVRGGLELNLRGHAVYPAPLNAHDHLQLNAIPRLPHAAPFADSYEWIDAMRAHRRTAPVMAAVEVDAQARLWHGALKNLLGGATVVAHHDPWDAVFDDPHFPVAIVRRSGWAHSLRLGAADGTASPYGPSVQDSFDATPRDCPWIVHVAEGLSATARGELAEMHRRGWLASNTVIVHGVGLSARDVDRIIESGAGVVWCPSSNVELFGSTLQPRRLFDAGRLALGTDSRLTGALDVLDELRVASAHSDLDDAELLRLVTTDAAALLRMERRGTLCEGSHADCIVVRDDGRMFPSLARVARADLRLVVRAGLPAVADAEFEQWFTDAGVPVAHIELDGRPKLIDARMLRADAAALEPGLEVVHP